MEIPYIVNPRKDTGLNNSKIAIWLFLASEVMLFGGLFSSYIFLRVYADYPWPERALPVLPGLINTFILIASSVTVVFAWAALKMRKWGMFVGNMSFTILCAAIFMVFKAKEYSGKFNHHGTQTSDYAWLEGHLKYEKDDVTHGNVYNVAAESVNFSLDSVSKKYLAAILEQSKETPLTLKEDYLVREITGDTFTQKKLFSKGEVLTPAVLEQAKAFFIKARTHNQKVRTQLLKDAWVEVRDSSKHPELVGLGDFESKVKNAAADVHTKLVKQAEENNELLIANGNMIFEAQGTMFRLDSGWGRMTDSKEGKDTDVKLLDGTVLSGEAGNSSLVYEYVDALDFRHLVMKAESKGLDADALIEKSPILHLEGEGGDKIRKLWATHKVWREFLRADLKQQKDSLTGEGRLPTEIDLYRVTWQQIVAYAALDYTITADNWKQLKENYPSMWYDIPGPSKEHKATFPKNVSVARDQVRFDSVFSPKMNNYYAIYFTITGLHGLHVIGGAIVLGYYLFFGRKMYLSNPDWLANRVEVGGLFWHFVDLVWILVFPIFYLM